SRRVADGRSISAAALRQRHVMPTSRGHRCAAFAAVAALFCCFSLCRSFFLICCRRLRLRRLRPVERPMVSVSCLLLLHSWLLELEARLAHHLARIVERVGDHLAERGR